MWPLILEFAFKLFTGEVWHVWQEHKAKEKAQAIADSPETKDELITVFKDGKV
jgi:hypothetical protein